MERRKCLERLGLQDGATTDEIKKAYKKMALKYHPDKNSSDEAHRKFVEISQAYKFLTEPAGVSGEGLHPFHADFRSEDFRVFEDIFFHLFRPHHPSFFMGPDYGAFIYESSSDDEYCYYPTSPSYSARYTNPRPMETDSKKERRQQKKKEKKMRQKERQEMRKAEARQQQHQQSYQQRQQQQQQRFKNNYSDDINYQPPKSDKPKASQAPSAEEGKESPDQREPQPKVDQAKQSPQKMTKKDKKKLEGAERKREFEMKKIGEELLKKQEQEREKMEKKKMATQQKEEEEEDMENIIYWFDNEKKSRRKKEKRQETTEGGAASRPPFSSYVRMEDYGDTGSETGSMSSSCTSGRQSRRSSTPLFGFSDKSQKTAHKPPKKPEPKKYTSINKNGLDSGITINFSTRFDVLRQEEDDKDSSFTNTSQDPGTPEKKMDQGDASPQAKQRNKYSDPKTQCSAGSTNIPHVQPDTNTFKPEQTKKHKQGHQFNNQNRNGYQYSYYDQQNSGHQFSNQNFVYRNPNPGQHSYGQNSFSGKPNPGQYSYGQNSFSGKPNPGQHYYGQNSFSGKPNYCSSPKNVNPNFEPTANYVNQGKFSSPKPNAKVENGYANSGRGWGPRGGGPYRGQGHRGRGRQFWQEAKLSHNPGQATEERPEGTAKYQGNQQTNGGGSQTKGPRGKGTTSDNSGSPKYNNQKQPFQQNKPFSDPVYAAQSYDNENAATEMRNLKTAEDVREKIEHMHVRKESKINMDDISDSDEDYGPTFRNQTFLNSYKTPGASFGSHGSKGSISPTMGISGMDNLDPQADFGLGRNIFQSKETRSNGDTTESDGGFTDPDLGYNNIFSRETLGVPKAMFSTNFAEYYR